MNDAATSGGVTPPREEGKLLSRVRQGDLAAFGELIQPYERRVYRGVLRTTGDPTEAADVYQEALLAAWMRASKWRLRA